MCYLIHFVPCEIPSEVQNDIAEQHIGCSYTSIKFTLL